MKVVLAAYDFSPSPSGGEGIFLADLAFHLATIGWAVTVVAPKKEGAEDFDARCGYDVVRVGFDAPNFLLKQVLFYILASRVIRNLRPDIVYTSRALILDRKCKRIAHFHTSRYGEAIGCWRAGSYFGFLANLSYIIFDWLLARNSIAIIIPHKNFLSYLPFTVDPERLQVIPSFRKVAAHLHNGHRSTGGSSSNKSALTHWLYMGRLDPRKGVQLLLNRLSDCQSRFPETQYTLTIAGSGYYENRLKSYAKKLEVDANVKFVGWVDPSCHSDLFGTHDVLLVPSYFEPYGNVVSEALAAGLPVVSSQHVAEQGQIIADFESATSLLRALSCIDRHDTRANKSPLRFPETLSPQEMISRLINDLVNS